MIASMRLVRLAALKHQHRLTLHEHWLLVLISMGEWTCAILYGMHGEYLAIYLIVAATAKEIHRSLK